MAQDQSQTLRPIAKTARQVATVAKASRGRRDRRDGTLWGCRLSRLEASNWNRKMSFVHRLLPDIIVQVQFTQLRCAKIEIAHVSRVGVPARRTPTPGRTHSQSLDDRL